METPFYFFVNSCDSSPKEFLKESFPEAVVVHDDMIIMEAVVYWCTPVSVSNMNEVSSCLQLYVLNKE